MDKNEVVLVGKAEFDAIYQSLKKVRDQFEAGNQEMGALGKKTQDTLEKTRKKTEDGIKSTAGGLRRLASQLYSDFKALLSLNALQESLKISSQFRNAITESVKLSNTVRRLGNSFGISGDEFGKFQASVARGLGDIGAGTEEASRALEGLAGLGVRGQKSALGLVKGAVTLAGMSGEKGNEGNVAGLLAKAIQSQGKDVNDAAAQKEMIGEVTAAVQVTGKQASEILGAMDQIFSTMDRSLRGKIGPEAMTQMATMAATVGPMATKAMQEYLAKGQIERLPQEMQGFNIFGKGGQIDFKALKKFVDSTKGRIGMDPRRSLQTAGFSEDAAEGLLRIAEQSDRVKDSLSNLAKASRDNEEVYKRTLGLGDAFRGTINTLKGRLEELTKGVSQTITDFFAAQIGDVAGSTVVAGGGAVVAAMLAGGGLRGIFSGMVGKAATEKLTGEKVQPVYVTNSAEIGAAASGGGLLGGGAKVLGKGLALGTAAVAGYQLGDKVINPMLDKYTTGTSQARPDFEGNVIERFFAKLDQKFGYMLSGTRDLHTKKILVETKEPNLRIRDDNNGRGATQ